MRVRYNYGSSTILGVSDMIVLCIAPYSILASTSQTSNGPETTATVCLWDKIARGEDDELTMTNGSGFIGEDYIEN